MDSSMDCLFCKMANGSIPVTKIYENNEVFCIRDIHPQSKTHFLIIPKQHYSSLADVYPSDSQGNSALMGKLFEAATHVARRERLLPSGFRSVINTESDAGQTVFHLHLHVLGGEPLRGGFGA